MQYKSGVARNLARSRANLALRTSSKGEVQRAGNRVRVSTHCRRTKRCSTAGLSITTGRWTTYFRFRAKSQRPWRINCAPKLSPSEKAAIERTAYCRSRRLRSYTRAKTLTLRVSYIGARSKDNLLQAIELLNQAVARSNFCLLTADWHTRMTSLHH